MSNSWDNKYPKAFEAWYYRHHNYNYKQSCYNAWKAGREHQKGLVNTANALCENNLILLMESLKNNFILLMN